MALSMTRGRLPVNLSSPSLRFQIVIQMLLVSATAFATERPVETIDRASVEKILRVIDESDAGPECEADVATLRGAFGARDWRDSRNVGAEGILQEITATDIAIEFAQGVQRVKQSKLSTKSRNDVRKTIAAVRKLDAFINENKARLASATEAKRVKAEYGIDLALLPAGAAAAISRHEHVLVVRSLKGFTAESCKALTETHLPGIAIEQECLGDLTPERVLGLAASEKTLTIITAESASDVGLPVDVLESLASARGTLWLPSVHTLSEQSAGILAKHQGTLGLPNLARMTPETARQLCLHQTPLILGNINRVRATFGPEVWDVLKSHPSLGPEIAKVEKEAVERAAEGRLVDEAEVVISLRRREMGGNSNTLFLATLRNQTDGNVWGTVELRTVMGNFVGRMWDVRAGGSQTDELKYPDKYFIKQTARECEVFVDLVKLTKNGEDILGECRVVYVIDDFVGPAEFDRFHVPEGSSKVRLSSMGQPINAAAGR